MKKTFSILALAAAVLCSCDKNADCVPCQKAEENQEPATLSVSLGFDDPETRAVTAYTTAQDYEKAVNSVQILVFDASGKINMYKDAGTTVSDIQLSTTAGQKTVWAVVNGPDLSAVANLSALQAKAVDLADNSLTKTEGFVMAGSTSCTVSATGGTAAVTVSRLVSRVALQKVTMPYATDVIEAVKAFSQYSEAGAEFIGPILKITGIAYITQIGSELCIDANEKALASRVEMAGKIAICILTVPIAHEAFVRIIGIIK